MLVGKRMTKDPITVTPDEFLSQAREKLTAGGFRLLPVVSDGELVGVITDRDLRAHVGDLARTKINGVMTEKPLTVEPSTTLESAAQTLLTRKIGGLPVTENGRLVGVITTSDMLKAFLDVLGATEEASARIDFVVDDEGHGLTEASAIVSHQGGEVLGLGTYRGQWGGDSVCYLRIRTGDAERIATILGQKGFNVLGVHSSSM
jgi:acetoin utilization protein AcuB